MGYCSFLKAKCVIFENFKEKNSDIKWLQKIELEGRRTRLETKIFFFLEEKDQEQEPSKVKCVTFGHF